MKKKMKKKSKKKKNIYIWSMEENTDITGLAMNIGLTIGLIWIIIYSIKVIIKTLRSIK